MPKRLPLVDPRGRDARLYVAGISAALAAILLIGNFITALVRDSVRVKEGSYCVRQGFPLFTNADEYIRLVKKYPYNPGVKLTTHRLVNGESLWDVAYNYNISIDTLIAANPFISSLIPKDGIEVVVPATDGVLVAINDVFDVRRMKSLLDFKGEVRGDYFPTIFKLISTDDIRLVFFKRMKPVIVNAGLEKLYRIKNIFQSPLKGNFTSLFGSREHPYIQDGTFRFHNGVDIVSRYGNPICPAREGMVIFTGWRGGFGNTIIIQHDEGYSTLYGHLSSINVKVGAWVTKDCVVGHVGSTGFSTGPHLHFTVMKHGQDVNPLLFIW